ncbi:MAG TPA: SIMPL domain-containing protein [Acidimicrobiales bacterium]|nr:SIMPL domain-containing protein [Acidimicrobiales bacterium]
MQNQPIITVDATGTASAPPDIARIQLLTSAEDPAPGDALTTCSLLTERVLGALRDAGVADSDLETTSIELDERRDREEGTVKYRASSSFVATVRPPGEAGRVVAAAVEAAGTGVEINGVGFDIDDRDPLVSVARRDAVARAVSAARELAEAAGLVLGPLVDLTEGGVWRPPRPRRAMRQMAAAAAPPPVELGELSVAVTVTAVFGVAASPGP